MMAGAIKLTSDGLPIELGRIDQSNVVVNGKVHEYKFSAYFLFCARQECFGFTIIMCCILMLFMSVNCNQKF